MRRGRLAVLGALPILALAGGQGMAAGQAAQGRITAAVRATGEDTSPTRTYGSPFLAFDPENPAVIVAATPEMRTRTCRLMRSLDAGQTWKLVDALPAPETYPFCFTTSGTSTQTPIRFGRNGTIYYALNGWDNQDLGVGADHPGTYANFSVLVAKSTNLGDNWNPVMVRNARGKVGPGQAENNRPITGLAVDRRSAAEDLIYVGWNQSYPQASPAVPSQAVVAASADGGKTFGDPVKVVGDYYKDVAKKPDPEKWGGGSPQVAVATDGTVYVAFYGSATGQPPTAQANSILVAKSTDRGKTFTTTEVAAGSGFFGPMTMAWSPAGGPGGTVHLIYEDKLAKPDLGDRDIFTRRSTDGGRTWSDAKQLNDDAPSATEGGHAQVTPSISVAPNGRIDTAWWDFRNDIGLFTNDVYSSSSEDNGATWSKNVRVNDRSIDRRLGVWSNGYDMRQPVGVASTDKFAVFAWDDTRNSDAVTQGQDVYSAVIQHEAIGSGSSNALRYAIAALSGLAVVGLILLALSLATGRRRPQTDLPVATPDTARGRVGSS